MIWLTAGKYGSTIGSGSCLFRVPISPSYGAGLQTLKMAFGGHASLIPLGLMKAEALCCPEDA